MSEIDVQMNSVNICILLPNTSCMLYYHFTEMRVVWTLRNLKDRLHVPVCRMDYNDFYQLQQNKEISERTGKKIYFTNLLQVVVCIL